MNKENLRIQELCIELMDKSLITAEKYPFKIVSEPRGIKFDYSSAVVLAGLNEYEGMKIGTPCRTFGSPHFYRLKAHKQPDVFYDSRSNYIVVSFVKVTGTYKSKVTREQIFYVLVDIYNRLVDHDINNSIVDYLKKNSILSESVYNHLIRRSILTSELNKILLFAPCQIDLNLEKPLPAPAKHNGRAKFL